MDKSHIFISYFKENRDQVARLRDELIAAGEKVWWDQDMLPGQNWRLAIRKAMSSAYAVVVCFSSESEERSRSGVYPELRDAIEMLRQYGPDRSFLFPARLSECRIPEFQVDSMTMLSDLQYVDLFPGKKRKAGMVTLIAGIRQSPEHPKSSR